jgi:hypothetical protein
MTDSDRTVNVPLLRKAVEWAEGEHALGFDSEGRPYGAWYQGEWMVLSGEDSEVTMHCGTSYCIAGYVAQTLEPRFAEGAYVDDVHVAEFARDALGITDLQASRLFHGSNKIRDVRQVAERIAGEPL